MDHLVFDTRYTGDGFCFESAEFPQGNVMAALGWSSAGASPILCARSVRPARLLFFVRVACGRRGREPSASSRASSMSSLCDVRPAAAWRRAVVFHDERPSGGECQLGVGFALVVGSLIDAALIGHALPCHAELLSASAMSGAV